MLPDTYVEGFHYKEAVKKMKYVEFGKTGLKVSKLSQGGCGFAEFYGRSTEEESIATVIEGLKKGINYIDTAPYYGQGESETLIGKALKSVPREAYYLATKVGRYGKTPADGFDFTYDKTKWSVQNSLNLLGVDYVDVIQVHDLEFAPSLDIVVNETLPALAEIVKEGKARFIGITGYPISLLKETVDRSTIKIDAVLSYARDILSDDTLQEFIPYFKSKEMAIINAAAPGCGLLTNAPTPVWHPAQQKTKDIVEKARAYCKEQGVEMGRLAIYHSMQQPGDLTCLIGMNTREILRSNIDLVVNGLSEKETKVLNEIKQKFFKDLKKAHWEGIEVARYRQAVAALKNK